jgi:hypothetical protein
VKLGLEEYTGAIDDRRTRRKVPMPSDVGKCFGGVIIIVLGVLIEPRPYE